MPFVKDMDPNEYEDDEAYCTEFQTDGERVEKGLLWEFICPRCGHENQMVGDPEEFAGRPFACVDCLWVSLLMTQAMEGLKEHAGSTTDRSDSSGGVE